MNAPVDVCGQGLCMADAVYSFVWPGRGRTYICREHLEKLRAELRVVAKALGLPIDSLDVQHVPKCSARKGGAT